MDTPTNVLSLCAGIGAMDLGVKLALPGARTVCYVEREASCVETLVRRMSEGVLDDAPVWTDLRTFRSAPWCGVVDLITGGYPCQPFSLAGKQKGVRDERHLWPAIANIIGHIRPQWCFFENVSNHLKLGFPDVAADLQRMGYWTAAGLFTAKEVGAPHFRERLFILASHANRKGLEGRLYQPGVPAAPSRKRQEWNGHIARSSGNALTRWGWTNNTATLRVDDGAPTRNDQVRATGNTVVPAVVAYAMRCLAMDLACTS